MSILSNIVGIIHAIVGGHKSFDTLSADLDAMAAKNSEKLDWRNSLVDLLKLTNQDSSLTSREALAKELGYPGPYDGSADMNSWLHQRVLDRLR